MRTTILATATSALTAVALLTGIGSAAAEPVDGSVDRIEATLGDTGKGTGDDVDSDQGGDEQEEEGPLPGLVDADPFCVWITTFAQLSRCMAAGPDEVDSLSSLGYGSLGTGSLADLLSTVINTGSVVLSVDVPNSTGSYAPGSLGSYGPEAAIGALLVSPIGSIAGAS